MSTVKFQIKGNVAFLTIDRAEKRNALTQSMWQMLADTCDLIAKGNEVKVLVVSAIGDKAFSAGADIDELTDIIQDKQRLIANNNIVQQAQLKLQSLNIPTIAAINGVCVGGGMGIALCCDFRISVGHAKFGITPSKLGLLYSIEDTQRLVNIVGLARAKELLYLGKIISAEQANQWGLVTQVVEQNELTDSVETLVKQLLSVSGHSISGIKTTLAYLTGTNTDNESQVRELFDQAFSTEDFKEGAKAFLEKRAPEFS